jgi:hypothetical protein
MDKEKFEDFLCEKGDLVDNAVYAALCSLVQFRDDEASEDEAENALPWDMSIIGEAAEALESILKESGVAFCRPYHCGDDETPCYLDPDSDACKNPNCPFRTAAGKGV